MNDSASFRAIAGSVILARNETRGGNNLLLSGTFSAEFNITVSKLGLMGAY